MSAPPNANDRVVLAAAAKSLTQVSEDWEVIRPRVQTAINNITSALQHRSAMTGNGVSANQVVSNTCKLHLAECNKAIGDIESRTEALALRYKLIISTLASLAVTTITHDQRVKCLQDLNHYRSALFDDYKAYGAWFAALNSLRSDAEEAVESDQARLEKDKKVTKRWGVARDVAGYTGAGAAGWLIGSLALPLLPIVVVGAGVGAAIGAALGNADMEDEEKHINRTVAQAHSKTIQTHLESTIGFEALVESLAGAVNTLITLEKTNSCYSLTYMVNKGLINPNDGTAGAATLMNEVDPKRFGDFVAAFKRITLLNGA